MQHKFLCYSTIQSGTRQNDIPSILFFEMRKRTVLVIANVIFWFCGCAMLGTSIWLRFTNPTVKEHFQIHDSKNFNGYLKFRF